MGYSAGGDHAGTGQFLWPGPYGRRHRGPGTWVDDLRGRLQGLVERWLGVGTVVVVPSEADLPTCYLAGIPDPKRVMDLVWLCARAEREGKTVQVENR